MIEDRIDAVEFILLAVWGGIDPLDARLDEALRAIGATDTEIRLAREREA